MQNKTLEEMVHDEQEYAHFLFEHCYRHANQLGNVQEIVQQEDGTYTLTFANKWQAPVVCEKALIGDVEVYVDKANGEVYSPIQPDKYTLKDLSERLAQAVAVMAFQKGKEVVECMESFAKFQTKEELAAHIVSVQDNYFDSVKTSDMYGHVISNPIDIEYMWSHYRKLPIIETETNIFVSPDSGIMEKYNELAHNIRGSRYDYSKLDEIYRSCRTNIFGKDRTPEQQQAEFSKRLVKMYKQNPEELKMMLAQACYSKQLMPVLVTSFDKQDSELTQEKYGDPIYLSDASVKSMVSHQELYNIRDYLDFSESECVAIDGDCIIAAMCYRGPYTYAMEKTPKILSSIDFSEQLREIQERHFASVIMHSWGRSMSDFQQEPIGLEKDERNTGIEETIIDREP